MRIVHSEGRLLKVIPCASVPVCPEPVPALGPCGRQGIGKTYASEALPKALPMSANTENLVTGALTSKPVTLEAGSFTHKACVVSSAHKAKDAGRTGTAGPLTRDPEAL